MTMDLSDNYTLLTQEIAALKARIEQQQGEMTRRFENSLNVGQRLYLRGMYRGFDAVRQSLQLTIEGREHYYPLTAYEGAWLPMPDTLALVFQSDADSDHARILGFENQGRMIPPARRLTLKLLGVDSLRNECLIEHPHYGRIRVTLPAQNSGSWKTGMQVSVKEIEAMPEVLLVPDPGPQSSFHSTVCRKTVSQHIWSAV